LDTMIALGSISAVPAEEAPDDPQTRYVMLKDATVETPIDDEGERAPAPDEAKHKDVPSSPELARMPTGNRTQEEHSGPEYQEMRGLRRRQRQLEKEFQRK